MVGLKLPVNGVNHYATVDCRICPHNWWYREPRIIDTFLESCDFAGKTVVPFATSGMSPLGDSAKNMQQLVPEAKVVNGKRFAASASGKELAAWAQEWL